MPIGYDNGVKFAYMMDENGNLIGKVGGIETVTMAITEDNAPSYTMPNSISFTMKWKSARTSRKTFCRELVKLGFTKSEAKRVAWTVKGNYGQILAAIRMCGKEHVAELLGKKR